MLRLGIGFGRVTQSRIQRPPLADAMPPDQWMIFAHAYVLGLPKRYEPLDWQIASLVNRHEDMIAFGTWAGRERIPFIRAHPFRFHSPRRRVCHIFDYQPRFLNMRSQGVAGELGSDQVIDIPFPFIAGIAARTVQSNIAAACSQPAFERRALIGR